MNSIGTYYIIDTKIMNTKWEISPVLKAINTHQIYL